MRPMTRRIGDADENRHVPLPCLGESLLAPRPPIHRVGGVLKEVGRSRTTKPVHTFSLSQLYEHAQTTRLKHRRLPGLCDRSQDAQLSVHELPGDLGQLEIR